MDNLRVINQGTKTHPRWVVLTSDYREVEYTGKSGETTDAYEDCCRYLRSICPTGKCED